MRGELPAGVAMALGIGLALLLWRLHGLSHRQSEHSSVHHHAGWTVRVEGLFWLVIRNQTVPVSAGGHANLLWSLTTTYLPPGPSLCAIGLVIALLGLFSLRGHRQAAQEAMRKGSRFQMASCRFSAGWWPRRRWRCWG